MRDEVSPLPRVRQVKFRLLQLKYWGGHKGAYPPITNTPNNTADMGYSSPFKTPFRLRSRAIRTPLPLGTQV
jgi:hypothetical protein